MGSSTARLGLYKPDTVGEVIDVSKFNSNFDLLDLNAGFRTVTSVTRPASPYVGQAIRETDTGRYRVWTGAGWEVLQRREPNQAYVPTWTVEAQTAAPSVGNGNIAGRYVIYPLNDSEGLCFFKIIINIGASGASGGGPAGNAYLFSLPRTSIVDGFSTPVIGRAVKAGVGHLNLLGRILSGSDKIGIVMDNTGALLTTSYAFGGGSQIFFSGFYECTL